MSENSIESILSMISSNPDLINKISSAVSAGGDDLSKNLSSVISLISEDQKSNDKGADIFEKIREKTDTHTHEFADSSKNQSDEKIDSFLFSLSKSISKNSSLLLALKPYLCKGRCDMIDAIVKISKLASVMNLAK